MLHFSQRFSAVTLTDSTVIGSDDDNLMRAEITNATMSGKELTIKNGMISLGNGESGEKKILRVKLAGKTRNTLEVRAYAKH